MTCRHCSPSQVDWKEQGFYGYSYPCCSKTAFIIKIDHADIREEEYNLVHKLVEKYYPSLKLSGISLKKPFRPHWYEILLLKDK